MEAIQQYIWCKPKEVATMVSTFAWKFISTHIVPKVLYEELVCVKTDKYCTYT